MPFTERPARLEGAGGLVSTVPDFLRFCQLLLNKGELDGVRVLSGKTVALITKNGSGRAAARRAADPQLAPSTYHGKLGNGTFHLSPDFLADDAGANSRVRVSFKRGESFGQKDLRPAGMTTIMRASGVWFRGAGVDATSVCQQLAPDTHMKLGRPRASGRDTRVRMEAECEAPSVW